MNSNRIVLLAGIITTLSFTHCNAMEDIDASATLQGKTFFNPRSQSTDAARDLVGWHRFLHAADRQDFYNVSSFTLEYTRSFRPHRLAEYFFGTNTITIAGSQVQERSSNYLLADYFGLSPLFYSTVVLKPILQNAIGDVAWYGCYQSWYLRIHAPLVWTKSRIQLYERIENDGLSTPFPPGYMAIDEVTAPYASFTAAMRGTKSYGDVEPLQFGKIACNGQSKAGLSEIQAVLGYDLVNHEYGHAGFNLRLSLPTGTRPKSEYLFPAIVGNGKHWELGVGFTGQIMIWEMDGEQQADFFFDMNAMHFFNARQQRSFDFCKNGFGSRYILLKDFNPNGIYNGITEPAINLTTLWCDVSNAIQIDTVIMFDYQYRGFTFDIGYNAWVRSKDKICLKADPFAATEYGFKGIQNVMNADSTTDSTQSNATLVGNRFSAQALVADPNPPVFIPFNALNVESAASPMQVTDALFFNFSYAWNTGNPEGVQPYTGFGFKAEFEGVRPKEVLPNKNALSQWSVWSKSGVAW